MSLARATGSPCTRGMAKSERATQELTLASVEPVPSSTSRRPVQRPDALLLVHGIRPGVRCRGRQRRAVRRSEDRQDRWLSRRDRSPPRVALSGWRAASLRRHSAQPRRNGDERLAGTRGSRTVRRPACGTRQATHGGHDPPRRPVVALVGRPNVGKSTFIARLTGRYEEAANTRAQPSEASAACPAGRSRGRPGRPAGRPLPDGSERRPAAILAAAPRCPARRDPVDRRCRRAGPAPAARPGLPRPGLADRGGGEPRRRGRRAWHRARSRPPVAAPRSAGPSDVGPARDGRPRRIGRRDPSGGATSGHRRRRHRPDADPAVSVRCRAIRRRSGRTVAGR